MKRNFSKTGIVLVGCMLVCLILFLAVGMPNGFFGDGGKGGDLDDDGTPKIGEVINGNTPILVFDKSEGAKKLIKAFDEGTIESVEVLYDQGGGNLPYKTTDQDEIRTVYKALKNITITGESDMSVTDAYHYVTFTFNDDTSYGYRFESTEFLCFDGSNYTIAGSGDFFDFLRSKCTSE